MIIVCPKCSLKGKSSVDLSKIKKLRCKHCKHIFSTISITEETYTNENIPAITKAIDADQQGPGIQADHIVTVLNGIEEGHKFRLCKTQNIIGRKNADITLPDPMISRQHATIEIYDKKALLKDLGSSNGIYYNGKKVKIVILNNGDRIQLGETIVEYNAPL